MSSMFDNGVPFHKMQGCGNDFVVIDNRSARVPEADMAEWARKVCRKAFGVGADGLFFLEDAPADSGLAYRWHFYNSDGSRAEMCGNASRCAARLAHAIGLAPERHSFGTDAGPIAAEVFPASGLVKVQLTPPRDLTLDIDLSLDADILRLHFVVMGVPHAVFFVEDVAAVNVRKLGHDIRFHGRFAPAGTNVNFVQVQDKGRMLLRTYERGVEDETYACGTGAAASQIVAASLGLTGPSAALTTTGGETLGVSLEDGKVFLQGAAELTFRGELFPRALGLSGD
ncbi:diaminopimelate epimerase [Desulfovibrio sp.]